MINYYLFAGENYYPSGGMYDFIGVFPSLGAAEEKAESFKYNDWYHIVSAETMKVIVAKCNRGGKWALEGESDWPESPIKGE